MPVLAIPAAVDILILALMAAILIWAARPLLEAVFQGLTQIPILAPLIGSRLFSAIEFGIRSQLAIANAAVSPLTALFDGVATGVWSIMDATWSAGFSLWALSYRIVTGYLPALEFRAASFALRLYALAIDYAGSLYVAALQYAGALYEAALAYALGLYTAAVAYALGLYASSISFAQSLYEAGLAFDEALYQAETSFARSLYDSAVAYAGSLYAAALQYAQALYAAAVGYADVLYRDAIDYSRGLAKLTEDYALALHKLALAFAAAEIAQVLARVIRLERSKCQQFCDPLGDLGQFLQDVEQTGLAALLVALAVEMAHDPRGTASAIDGLIGADVRSVIGALEGAAGLRRAA